MPFPNLSPKSPEDPTVRAKQLLLAVCSTPPLTSGTRTLNRLSMAQGILGFGRLEIANIFAVPTQSSGQIAALGKESSTWLKSRHHLEAGLSRANGVMLAYGTTPPSGPARLHWRSQVEWLHGLVEDLDFPVWTVSDEPRHPSRWQRHTSRTYPELPFEEALAVALKDKSRLLSGPI